MPEIKDVSAKLAEHKLDNPLLNMLVPDENTYSILFLQRKATVVASTKFIGNQNTNFAKAECLSFFQNAASQSADLAITPEYSCPWAALEQAIVQGIVPAAGALWVIGCESTTLDELEDLKKRLAAKCQVVYDAPNAVARNFVDPVAFVFLTKLQSGEVMVVVLVQFKTAPMADPISRLEPDNLICGNFLYRFRNVGEQSISLMTLICSDSLALAKPENAIVNGQIGQITPLLLLHLQLNLKPRDTIYSGYRQSLLQQQREREVFTANWAAGTEIIESGKKIRDFRSRFGVVFSI